MNRSMKIFLGMYGIIMSTGLHGFTSLISKGLGAAASAKDAFTSTASKASDTFKSAKNRIMDGEIPAQEMRENGGVYDVFKEFKFGNFQGTIDKITEAFTNEIVEGSNERSIRDFTNLLINLKQKLPTFPDYLLVLLTLGIDAKSDFIKAMTSSSEKIISTNIKNPNLWPIDKWLIDTFSMYYDNKDSKTKDEIAPYLSSGYLDKKIDNKIAYKRLASLQKLLSIMAENIGENKGFKDKIKELEGQFKISGIKVEAGGKIEEQIVLNGSNAVALKEALAQNKMKNSKLLEHYRKFLKSVKEVIISYLSQKIAGQTPIASNQTTEPKKDSPVVTPAATSDTTAAAPQTTQQSEEEPEGESEG